MSAGVKRTRRRGSDRVRSRPPKRDSRDDLSALAKGSITEVERRMESLIGSVMNGYPFAFPPTMHLDRVSSEFQSLVGRLDDFSPVSATRRRRSRSGAPQGFSAGTIQAMSAGPTKPGKAPSVEKLMLHREVAQVAQFGNSPDGRVTRTQLAQASRTKGGAKRAQVERRTPQRAAGGFDRETPHQAERRPHRQHPAPGSRGSPDVDIPRFESEWQARKALLPKAHQGWHTRRLESVRSQSTVSNRSARSSTSTVRSLEDDMPRALR